MRKHPEGIRLERLLLGSTLIPALFVIVFSGWADYVLASRIAHDTQDAMLLRTAYALASYLSSDEGESSAQEVAKHLSRSPDQLFKSAQTDEIEFLIQGSDGEILIGSPQLVALVHQPLPLPGAPPQFANQELQEQALRTVQIAHQTGAFTHYVLVKANSLKTTVATNRIFWSTLWPNLLLLMVISLVLMHGTRKALRPLQDVCTSMDERRAGDLRPISTKVTPLEIHTLITAMNRLLHRLAQATQEQQVFLSGAAHQLRTPLAGIQTQVELALEETTGRPHERMQRVLTAIEGLAHCSQQMLALARSSSQLDAQDAHTTFDLAEVAEDLGSIWLDTALKAQVELVFDLHATPVHGTRWMLQEMLSNLLDNAIKYSPPGGEVLVRCQTTADAQACLDIIDAGPGIPDDTQARVVSPFYRGNHPGIGGSGLGLTIVQEIIKRHDGKMQFLPNPTGPGTCVRVLLPVQEHNSCHFSA